MAKVGDTSFFRVNIYYNVLNRNGKIIKTEVAEVTLYGPESLMVRMGMKD